MISVELLTAVLGNPKEVKYYGFEKLRTALGKIYSLSKYSNSIQ